MTAALPLTPLADGTPHDRWHALREQVTAALDLAQAYTDFPPTLYLVRHYRARLHEADTHASPRAALVDFGPNGLWSAIDDVMTQARNHGFDWREKAPATPVLEMRHG